MDPEIDALFTDPTWYLHGLELRDPGWRAVARFVRIAPEDFDRLYWTLREVVVPRGREVLEIELDRLLAAPAPTPGPLRYVFHTAYCGSTLLARALGRWPMALTLFEPRVLFDLQRWLGARRWLFARGVPDEQLDAVVTLVRALLGRVPTPGHVALVKVHAGCNGLLPRLVADDHSPTLFLHEELPLFLAQVLKSADRRAQLQRLATAGLLGLDRFGRRGARELTVAQAAATQWLQHLHLYLDFVRARPACPIRAVRSAYLFHAPEATARAVAAHLALGPEHAGLEQDLAGVVATHAKTPERRFSLAQREADVAAAMAEHRAEVDEGLAWARELAAQAPFPDPLPLALAVPATGVPLPSLLGPPVAASSAG